ELGRLQAVAGDADDGGFVASHPALFNQLAKARHHDAAGGLAQNAFRLGEQGHRVLYGVLRTDGAPTAGRLNRPGRIAAVGRVADSERLGDAVWLDRRRSEEHTSELQSHLN